jgi:hypothetical protein
MLAGGIGRHEGDVVFVEQLQSFIPEPALVPYLEGVPHTSWRLIALRARLLPPTGDRRWTPLPR